MWIDSRSRRSPGRPSVATHRVEEARRRRETGEIQSARTLPRLTFDSQIVLIGADVFTQRIPEIALE